MQTITFFEGFIYLSSIIGLVVFLNRLTISMKQINFSDQPKETNEKELNRNVSKFFVEGFGGLVVFMISIISVNQQQLVANKTTYISAVFVAIGLLILAKQSKNFIEYFKYRKLKANFSKLVTIKDDFNSLAASIFKINDSLKIINLKLQKVKDEDEKKDLECMRDLLEIKKNNLSEISKSLKEGMVTIK